MIALLWRMSRGYRLRPWASPYLRWRLETYSGLHAEEITFSGFWRQLWNARAPFFSYLAWAAAMSKNISRREDSRRRHTHSGKSGWE
jgi:hypothetical protein